MENAEILIEFKCFVEGYYPVSEEAFNRLVDIAEVQCLEKNQILLPMGQVSRDVWYVYSGVLIAFFTDADGQTYNKNIFLDHQFAGSTVSALRETPSEFTIQALEATVLLRLNYKRYKELIANDEDLKNFYIAYLEKNWVIDKEQREISIVMEDATTRYQKLLEDYPNIHHQVPLQHIASNLGITPTQLSRIRKKMKLN